MPLAARRLLAALGVARLGLGLASGGVSRANAGTQGGCGAREFSTFGTQPLRFLARFGVVALAVGVSVAGKVTSAELVV